QPHDGREQRSRADPLPLGVLARRAKAIENGSDERRNQREDEVADELAGDHHGRSRLRQEVLQESDGGSRGKREQRDQQRAQSHSDRQQVEPKKAALLLLLVG